MKGSLPRLRAGEHACDSPHVVILGAGASRAACITGDANGRALPLMADVASLTGIEQLLSEGGVAFADEDFEGIYSRLVADPAKADLVKDIEQRLWDYFSEIELPKEANLYDRLLLSLRDKDVIATFNWDPLLCEAFKRNRHVAVLPRIIFLHGNVDLGVCLEHHQKGFLEHSCPECGTRLRPHKLLYPVAEKNYETDPLIANEWEELRCALEDAYIITIVGYSAPTTDASAKRLLLEAWITNPTRDFGQITIVDTKKKRDVESAWKPFFVRQHYSILRHLDDSYLFRNPRRSCDHFAMATLQQCPCRENPLPETTVLEELQAFVRPLIQEEEDRRRNGTPLAS